MVRIPADPNGSSFMYNQRKPSQNTFLNPSRKASQTVLNPLRPRHKDEQPLSSLFAYETSLIELTATGPLARSNNI